MKDGNRQTGRTWRMMREAIYYARSGHQVVITAATRHQLQDLEQMYKWLDGPLLATNVHFVTDFDLERKLRGFSEDTLLFRDHHAVEASESIFMEKSQRLEQENKKLKRDLNTILEFTSLALNKIDRN